jgi:hypothetical protein
LSGMGWWRVLWQARMRSAWRISAATTRFMGLEDRYSFWLTQPKFRGS